MLGFFYKECHVVVITEQAVNIIIDNPMSNRMCARYRCRKVKQLKLEHIHFVAFFNSETIFTESLVLVLCDKGHFGFCCIYLPMK